jgi:hypothetical protein
MGSRVNIEALEWTNQQKSKRTICVFMGKGQATPFMSPTLAAIGWSFPKIERDGRFPLYIQTKRSNPRLTSLPWIR